MEPPWLSRASATTTLGVLLKNATQYNGRQGKLRRRRLRTVDGIPSLFFSCCLKAECASCFLSAVGQFSFQVSHFNLSRFFIEFTRKIPKLFLQTQESLAYLSTQTTILCDYIIQNSDSDFIMFDL